MFSLMMWWPSSSIWRALLEDRAADVVADVGELARLLKRLHEEDSGDARGPRATRYLTTRGARPGSHSRPRCAAFRAADNRAMKMRADRIEGQNAIARHGRDGVRRQRRRAHRERDRAVARRRRRLARQRRSSGSAQTHFARIAALKPELVVFGSGARLRFPAPALLRPLIDARHRRRDHGHRGRLPHLQRPARRGSLGGRRAAFRHGCARRALTAGGRRVKGNPYNCRLCPVTGVAGERPRRRLR